jgi:hypothetical protein
VSYALLGESSEAVSSGVRMRVPGAAAPKTLISQNLPARVSSLGRFGAFPVHLTAQLRAANVHVPR